MQKYTGTKTLYAKPMTKAEYNTLRGWEMPVDEDPNEEGYLVEYADGGKPNHPDFLGYISWSPKDVFERSYKPCSGLISFGGAIQALKAGNRVARIGWNGKGMFVVHQKGYPTGIPCNKQTADAWGLKEGELFKCEPYLQIQMVNGSHSMWVPSINDVLAEDWQIVG